MNLKFIFFEAPGCKPCKKLLPKVQAAASRWNLSLQIVDIYSDEGMPLVFEYEDKLGVKINEVPLLITEWKDLNGVISYQAYKGNVHNFLEILLKKRG